MTIELNVEELVAITGCKPAQVEGEQRLHIRGVAVRPDDIRGGELFIPAVIKDESTLAGVLAEAWSRGAAAALIEGDPATVFSSLTGFPAERIFAVNSIRNAVELLARWWSAKLEIVVFAVLEIGANSSLVSEILKRLLLGFGRGAAANSNLGLELANALCLLGASREDRWAVLRCTRDDRESVLRVAELAKILLIPREFSGEETVELAAIVEDLGVTVAAPVLPTAEGEGLLFVADDVTVVSVRGEIDPFAGRRCQLVIGLGRESKDDIVTEVIDFVLPSFNSVLLPSVAVVAAAIGAYAGSEGIQILRQVVQGGAVTVSNRVSWLPWGHVITFIDNSNREDCLDWAEIRETLGAFIPDDGVPLLVISFAGLTPNSEDVEQIRVAIKGLREQFSDIRIIVLDPSGYDYLGGEQGGGMTASAKSLAELYSLVSAQPFSALLLVGSGYIEESNIADELVQFPAPRWVGERGSGK